MPWTGKESGANASVLWEPELQCSKNKRSTYRHFFWCIFFVCTMAHHIFGSLVLLWNGIFCHSVRSSKVGILTGIRDPIHLSAQIHFFVCISYNYSCSYCSRWCARVACINWLAILLGSEAAQSSGWANLLSILCSLNRLCSTYRVTCCRCHSATKRKSNSHYLFIRTFLLQFAHILNGVQNHWWFKLSDCHTCIRHIIIKLYLLSASSTMDFHFHLLKAVTATLQIFLQLPHFVPH